MKEFLMNLTTKQKTILGIIAAIIMIIIFIFAYKYFYIDTNKEESTEIEQSTNEAINNDTNEIGYEDNENLDDGILNSKKKKSAIIVHIIGEVNKPGVVKLEEGARIIDEDKQKMRICQKLIWHILLKTELKYIYQNTMKILQTYL